MQISLSLKEALRKKSSLFVKERISADLTRVLESSGLLRWCEVEPEEDGEGDRTYPEPRRIFVKYTPVLPIAAGYVKPVVMLEIGSRSLFEPFECRKVSSLVSSATPVSTGGVVSAAPPALTIQKFSLE